MRHALCMDYGTSPAGAELYQQFKQLKKHCSICDNELYLDLTMAMDEAHRDQAKFVFNHGQETKLFVNKLVDTMACSQTLHAPIDEADDKMARAMKLLELCKHITPKFTTLLKEAAGLVQQKTSTGNKKQKLMPQPLASSKSAPSTDDTDIANKKQKLDHPTPAGASSSADGQATPVSSPPPADGTPPKTEKTIKAKKGSGKGGGKGVGKTKKTVMKVND